MRAAGASTRELLDAGASIASLKRAGVSVEECKDAGVSVNDCAGDGLTGYPLEEMARSFKAKELKCLFDAEEVRRKAGVEYMKDDYTTREMKEAGATAAELKHAGVDAETLKKEGYTPAEIKRAFEPEELNKALSPSGN